MNITFDYFNQVDAPTFYLANPDGTPLYNLGTIKDRKLQLRYNALSTLTFTACSQSDGIPNDYYDFLEYRRLVYVDGIGVFMINDITIDSNSLVKTKNITCYSLEVIMSYKKLSLFKGTYNFYDPYAPSGTLLQEMLDYVPGWSIGTIDSSLLGVYRTFDVTDKTLYDFLTSEVSQTYQCVFVFDSANKTISAYAIENATTTTDIFISFDNLMKSFTITQSTDELVTAMTVLGGEDLSINLVNPIGTNTIYNFDYFKNINWMNQDLIDALNVWEGNVATWQPIYANLLTSLRIENGALLTLESNLTTLEGELSALANVRDVRIQQGLSITDVTASMTVVSASITDTSASIATQEGVIGNIQSQLSFISASLAFTNTENFSSTQLASLNNFIIGNTYTNTNFIQTTTMTEVEVQDIAQELYDQGILVLAKVSQPRYMFDIDSANFLFLQEYSPFISQLSLGCTLTVQLDENTYTYPALLGIDFNYDNPTEFKMILSNRMRIDDEKFQFSDLYGSTIDAGITTNFNSQKWNSVTDSYNTALLAGYNYVSSATTSGSGNIAVFGGITGTTIKDAGAMYVAPTNFSPALISDGTTFAYNYNVGKYNIIGRLVFFESSISLNGISGSTTSPLYISIPPSLHASSASLAAAFNVSWDNISIGAGYSEVSGLLPSSASQIGLYKEGNGVPMTTILPSDLSASSTNIYVSGQYFID